MYVTSGIHGGLLERSAGGLAAGMHAVGQDRLFEALAEMFGGKDASVSYAQIGQRLGMTEGALRGAMHRLRRRYRERLWAEVAQTVAPPDRVEDELRYLPTVVSQGS